MSMNTVVAVLLGAVAALLVAILVELGKIRGTLAKIPDPRNQREKEGRQMVTVNVGAVVSPDSAPVTVSEATEVEQPDPERLNPVEAVAKPAVSAAVTPPKPSQSGLRVVKCAHCGAENTSFRTECFQCGKSL